MNKGGLLQCWMRDKGFFSSHEVMRWGLDNYYLRADRTKRDFLSKGIITNVGDENKKFYGHKGKDALYRYVGVSQ